MFLTLTLRYAWEQGTRYPCPREACVKYLEPLIFFSWIAKREAGMGYFPELYRILYIFIYIVLYSYYL